MPHIHRSRFAVFDFADLLVLLALGALAWFWADSLKARERALAAARRACGRAAVQLLDETVALARLRLARNARGYLTLARVYRFEFSIQGHERRAGHVALTGARLDYTRLDLPAGGVYEAPPPGGAPGG